MCKDFPEEYKYFVDYTRNLGYAENPNYEKLKNNFIHLIREKMCENFDFVYDWTTKNELKKRENSNDVYMILDEKDQNDEEIVGGGNNNKINRNKTQRNEDDDLEVEDVDNDDNNENKRTNKEDEDKVESKCCLM